MTTRCSGRRSATTGRTPSAARGRAAGHPRGNQPLVSNSIRTLHAAHKCVLKVITRLPRRPTRGDERPAPVQGVALRGRRPRDGLRFVARGRQTPARGNVPRRHVGLPPDGGGTPRRRRAAAAHVVGHGRRQPSATLRRRRRARRAANAHRLPTSGPASARQRHGSRRGAGESGSSARRVDRCTVRVVAAASLRPASMSSVTRRSSDGPRRRRDPCRPLRPRASGSSCTSPSRASAMTGSRPTGPTRRGPFCSSCAGIPPSPTICAPCCRSGARRCAGCSRASTRRSCGRGCGRAGVGFNVFAISGHLSSLLRTFSTRPRF